MIANMYRHRSTEGKPLGRQRGGTGGGGVSTKFIYFQLLF